MTRLSLVFILFVAALTADAFTISGNIVAPDGDAVAGATVWINQDRNARKTECGPDGKFALDDVKVGPIEIVAWKDGFACGGYDAQVAGNAEITITLAEPGNITLRLIERRLDPRTRSAGPPEPIVGARILTLFVNDSFHVNVDDLAPLGFPNPRSDDAGVLTMSMLPKGGFASFAVTHRDFSTERIPPYPVDHTELTLQLYRGIILRGRVTNDEKQGVARARVSILRFGPPPLREYKETQCDPDGFYEAMVEAGDYLLVARHTGYASVDPVRATASADMEEATCDVSVVKGYPVTGQVLDKENKPVAGVSIQYIVDQTVFDETLSDTAGSFQLTAGTGAGKVRAIAPEGYIAGKGLDAEVTIANAAVALASPIVLEELPEIAGGIADASGIAQEGVIVYSLDLDPPAWTVTDSSGQFSLRLKEAPAGGTATFRAEHSRRFLRKDFSVTFADLAPLQIALEEFEPNLLPCDPARVKNALDGFRGKPAPAILCKDWLNLVNTGAERPMLMLEQLRGKVVVLIFWGGFDTTDAGLVRLMQMNTLFDAFRDADDVTIVGIYDSASEPNEVNTYLREHNVQYPVGVDNETATFDLYDISSIPQVVVIDKKGLLRYYDTEGRLLELIKGLRREGS